MATAGAFGEFDPFSVLNPSSIGTFGRAGLYAQADAETRVLDVDGETGETTTTRLGLVIGAVRVGARGVLSVSTAPLLDRTWGNTVRGTIILGNDTAAFRETYRASGAINDLRLAGAWAFSSRLVVGGGAHFFPGEQRLSVRREFDDSLLFGPASREVFLSYGGYGFSGGVQVKPANWLGIAASGRFGGQMRVRLADTLLSESSAPPRLGVAVRVDRWTGVSLAARVDRTYWSKMQELGTPLLTAFDSWEYGAGADLQGPRLGQDRTALRVGYRARTLPFGVNGTRIDERGIAGGIGLPVARGRASVDFTVERLARSGSGLDATENAWHYSFGLAVRP